MRSCPNSAVRALRRDTLTAGQTMSLDISVVKQVRIALTLALCTVLNIAPAFAANWIHWHKSEWLDASSIRTVGTLTYYHNEYTIDDKPPVQQSSWKWDPAFNCANGEQWTWVNDFDEKGNPIDENGAPLAQGVFRKGPQNWLNSDLFKLVCKR
jgi:hypothetical protein